MDDARVHASVCPNGMTQNFLEEPQLATHLLAVSGGNHMDLVWWI